MMMKLWYWFRQRLGCVVFVRGKKEYSSVVGTAYMSLFRRWESSMSVIWRKSSCVESLYCCIKHCNGNRWLVLFDIWPGNITLTLFCSSTYLLLNWGIAKGRFPLAFDPVTSCTPTTWPGMPNHPVSLPMQGFIGSDLVAIWRCACVIWLCAIYRLRATSLS